MIALYAIPLVFGVLLLFFSIYKEILWHKYNSALKTDVEETQANTQYSFDLRTLIISQSRWLSFLQWLDNELSIKLRICAVIAAVLFILKFTGIFDAETKTLAIIMLLVLVAVIVIPGLLSSPGVKSREKKLLDALPYFIELTAVCIQTGMTVESSIKFIAQHARELDINLSGLMLHLSKRAEVSGLEEALQELYATVSATEMRMFCATLQQSVHYGTSLYESLMELAKDIRDIQFLIVEEKIGSLSAKMSVPLILFIMFPIIILIAAPGILRIMHNGIF
jgi:tight adherence protein C